MQSHALPDFFTQYGNTDFPREKNYCPESDKLCSRCKKQFKSTQVRQRGWERMMNIGEKYHGRGTGRKEAHVTAGLQGAWQIANRLSYRKKLTGTGIGFHFPIHTPCRAHQNSKHNASALKQYTIAPYQGCRSWRAFSFCSLLIRSPIRTFSQC